MNHKDPEVAHVMKPAQTMTDIAQTADLYQALEAAVRKWLYITDEYFVKVVTASVIANRLPGDPFWLLVVAASGGAKTELLRGLSLINEIHYISDLTPQALISGYKGNSAGLLDRIGSYGIVVMKDFTTVLTMPRDKRHEIMASLREIYDGFIDKAYGNELTKHWAGKLGFIGGVTTVVDRHQNVYQTLGERFVQYRPIAPDPTKVTQRALENAGYEQQMREEIQNAFAAYLGGVDIPDKPVTVPEIYTARMMRLATFCACARSGVERSGYGSQEIAFVAESEIPTRLVKQFMTIFTALSVISGGFTESDYAIVYKIALDNLTSIRRKIIMYLFAKTEPATTAEVASSVGLPRNTVAKRLEDLEALGILGSDATGTGGALAYYWLSDEIREHLTAAQPSTTLAIDNIKQFFADSSLPEKSEVYDER